MPVREWNPAQIALMKHLILPGDNLLGKGRGLRVFSSLDALAAHFGVSRQTLYDWQQLPGWDDAMNTMAEKTFKSLNARFLTNLAAALLKPNPNDRLVQATVRYINPVIEKHEKEGEWDRILPDTTTSNQADTERIASEVLRSLSSVKREIILDFMSQVRNRETSEVLTERPSYQVMRMITEEEEELEQQEQERNTVELKVLPFAGQPGNKGLQVQPQSVNVTTARELQSNRPLLPPIVKTETGKWKPSRRGKK